MTIGTTRDQLFVSYSHRDEDALAEFLTMLARLISGQSGALVGSGHPARRGSWNERIVAALERAKVVLMLVSGAFLELSYVRDVELPRILRAHL